MDSPQELEVLVTNYLKNLFANSEITTPFSLTGQFPILDPMHVEDMQRMITDEEIGRTIKSIGAYKAPGPDGFYAVFYHSQW